MSDAPRKAPARKSAPRPVSRPTSPARDAVPVAEYVPTTGVDSSADPSSVLPDPIIPKF